MVVFGGAEKANDTPLNDQVVDDFLGLGLSQRTLTQIALEVNVPEGGQPTRGHGRAVLLFNGGKIGEVGPLNCLACVAGWRRDVVAVTGCHLFQFLQRADLLREFLTQPNHFFSRMTVVQFALLSLLVSDEKVQPIERNTSIVADDSTAAVGVRKSSNHVC